MKKIICDICGRDIPGNEQVFNMSIGNSDESIMETILAPAPFFKIDVCKKCANDVWDIYCNPERDLHDYKKEK